MKRFRIHYEQTGNLIYVSVLEMQKIWERTCRRAGFELVFSQGFHPQPKIQILLPLPLGFSGLDEKVDIWFQDGLDTDQIKQRLPSKMPEGISIKDIESVDLSEKSLVNRIEFADYLIEFFQDLKNNHANSLKEKISKLLNSNEIIRTRRGKQYDLRSLIEEMEYSYSKTAADQIKLKMLAKPGKTGRPDEVIRELGFDLTHCRIFRTKIYY